MSPSQNRFAVATLIQALECEVERQIETESSKIYDVYFVSRRKVLEKIVAELRRVSPEEETPVFWINFGSALITRIEKRVAYSLQHLTNVERVSMFGELSGLRVVLGVLKRVVDGKEPIP